MKSLWQEIAGFTQEKPEKKLTGDIKTEVLIIGGGMAGILCAYRLKQKGIPCIVVEAKQAGGGVTGFTTAKITAQHGLFYDKLLRKSGMEAARQYYNANMSAIAEYRALAGRFPCDFEEKTAYVYSTDNRAKLENEAAAYGRLGIPGGIMEKPPLPLETVGALGMSGQAQFHPLKLLHALAKEVDMYERTFVREISGNTAITAHGKIFAGHIILATHFPMVNVPGLYFLKLYQHRSYVVALENAAQINGMFVDERQDGHSFRNHGDLLLLGGGDHRTGKKGGGWAELRGLARRAYPQAAERFAWATQDCMSLDGIPYIGVHRKSTPNLYVASGFNKWGMSGSMMAAMTLTDLIATGKSEYSELFSPQRSMFQPQLFLNTVHAAAGLLSFGKRCSHMGCVLHWNPNERTWDCSCHGSRFDESGHIINNPAKRGISV